MYFVLVTLLLLILGACYLACGTKEKQQLKVVTVVEEKKEVVPDETKTEDTSQSSTSFKKLKQQSKGGKKKGKGGSNPEHPMYTSALKGFNSSIVDLDYYMFENGAILAVVAEEVSIKECNKNRMRQSKQYGGNH
jgi:hypothetical protein